MTSKAAPRATKRSYKSLTDDGPRERASFLEVHMAKTEATKNDVNNVSDGTGLAGGYFFRAPLGS